jgi:serine protease Do
MNRIFKPALMIMAVLAASTLVLGTQPAKAGATEKDIADIAKKAYPSVVRVEVQNHMRRVATGVVIDKDGSIVTTALMSPRNEKITITTSDGKTMDAEFLGFDTETQLAVLRAKGKGLPAIPLGDSDGMAAGSWVCVIGISPEQTPAVTQGIVSSIAEDRLRLNIWVTPGSSGGPVVDEKGRMVGLLRGIYTEDKPVVFQFRDKEQAGSGFVMSRAEAPSSGMAIAVPIAVVRSVAAEIREKGKVQRGWLGVGAGLDEDGRLVIGSIDPGSAAELAKLGEGDIIVGLDGKVVTNPDVLVAEIRKMKPGQVIVLKIERDGKPMDVKVKVGEYSEDAARKEMELRFPRIFPPMGPEGVPGGPPGQAAPSGQQPRVPGQPQPMRPGQPAFPSFEMKKYIGVYCNELSPELAAYFGIKEGTGLLVAKVSDKSPAQKAGLKVGDIVVRADGKRVTSSNTLIDLLQDKKKGDTVKIEILRDKKPMTMDVVIDEEAVRGGLEDSEGFQTFLESWQDYTDGLQNELRKWGNDYAPELKADMKKIGEELTKKGRESGQEIKGFVKTMLKKV